MKFDTTRPIPILLVGDGPPDNQVQSGLGRITHDLAWMISSRPEFEVGWLGRMAFGRKAYPFAMYSFGPHEQWGEGRIQEAWMDLSAGRKGIIFTVWDASRLGWFVQNGVDRRMDEWFSRDEFERWGYFMLDGEGLRRGSLPVMQHAVLDKYDRVLTASRWARDIALNSKAQFGTQGLGELDWLPHPLNTRTFHRAGRKEIRSAWAIAQDEILLGIVMTNQERKSWGTSLQAVRLLLDAGVKLKLWIHTDKMSLDARGGYWDIEGLITELGLNEFVRSDFRSLSDSEMAMRYSALDLLLMISASEGFCYPAVEALACGTPVLTGSYGAQAELAQHTCPLVEPRGFEVRTHHAIRRAVYSPEDIATVAQGLLKRKRLPEDYARSVEHLESSRLGKQWLKWMMKGIDNAK